MKAIHNRKTREALTRFAVDTIISFAKDTYRSIFSREEAKTIKGVMEAFGKDKEDYKAIGTFLVFTADKKEELSNSEYYKVAREVDDVAIGRYEQAQNTWELDEIVTKCTWLQFIEKVAKVSVSC